MQKFLSIVALLAVMFFASSGYNGSGKPLAPGDRAPELSLSNDECTFSLGQSSGEYVLLTFWSSSDALSRVSCNKYSAWFEKHPQNVIKHVAVNFDNVPALFDEVVRLDNLDTKAQFNVNGLEASQISSDFGLDKGFGSILISPEGLITAFNPTTTDLSSLI